MLLGRLCMAVAAAALVAVLPALCPGQVPRPVPYNPHQLSDDASVGNLEGTHRFGQQLKSDPDVGMGYSFHVRPAKVLGGEAAGDTAAQRSITAQRAYRTLPEPWSPAFAQGSFAHSPFAPGPFDATAGIRSFGPPSGPPPFPGIPYGGLLPYADEIVERSIGFLPGAPTAGFKFDIYHQPLIQIKVRVVEVVRDDTLKVASVLDYITRKGNATKISGNNVNENLSRTTTATRFPQPRNDSPGTLLNIANTTTMLGDLRGSGALVNLTGSRMNYLAELLAVELGADVITAPEVVTLNGQNVEFLAGSKTAFPLGQNVISGNANSIQQLFYKHVGTYISVTPTIVNWGKHAEGRGEAAINESQIPDWGELVRWMLRPDLQKFWAQTDSGKALLERLKQAYGPEPGMSLRQNSGRAQRASHGRARNSDEFAVATDILVVEQARIDILEELNKYSQGDLLQFGAPIADLDGGDCGCGWKPDDCTIDLSIIVRLSEAPVPEQLGIDPAPDTAISTSEVNVRAVANILQIKSGHGLVMAGLIGNRESEDIRKVPVLGEAPLIGSLFRSKTTNRQKTEILVFIETRVMDSEPAVARAQSYEDFLLGEPYVSGHFLDNPLEYGMYRAGFGTYLPPHSKQEQVFWERLGRKVRKAATEVDDVVK